MADRKRMPKGLFSATEVGALIEELRANFKTFGEGQEDIRRRLAALEAEALAFKDFITFQKLATDLMRKDLNSLTVMSRKNTADIAAIKDDVRKNTADIAKNTADIAKNTADIAAIRDDVKDFGSRVTAVEAKVGL